MILVLERCFINSVFSIKQIFIVCIWLSVCVLFDYVGIMWVCYLCGSNKGTSSQDNCVYYTLRI